MNQSVKRVFTHTLGAFALLAALAGQMQAQQQLPVPDKSQPGRPGQVNQQPRGEYRSGVFDDASWIKQVAQGNHLEIKVAEFASKKSDHAEVKQYAERLVQDHKKASEKLEQIAMKQGVMLQKELDSHHKQMCDKFESYTGDQLNREFAKHAVKSHVKEIAHFQRASQEAKDEDLKTFARETLPVLRQHLEEARDLAKAVGLDEATITSLMQESSAIGAPGSGIETERRTGEADKDKDLPKNENKNDQPKP